MSGLFDDEGKTPARGRKHKAAEEAVAELVEADETLPEPGHPFEDSIKAPAEVKLADDIHDHGLPGYVKTGSPGMEQVNRKPISLERRQRILDLVWARTQYRTGRVEWRDLRDLLKEVIELL